MLSRLASLAHSAAVSSGTGAVVDIVMVITQKDRP